MRERTAELCALRRSTAAYSRRLLGSLGSPRAGDDLGCELQRGTLSHGRFSTPPRRKQPYALPHIKLRCSTAQIRPRRVPTGYCEHGYFLLGYNDAEDQREERVRNGKCPFASDGVALSTAYTYDENGKRTQPVLNRKRNRKSSIRPRNILAVCAQLSHRSHVLYRVSCLKRPVEL